MISNREIKRGENKGGQREVNERARKLVINKWRERDRERRGRLQLTVSVLTVLPMYFMACFKLPRWIINRIDKIRRDFLRGNNSSRSNKVHLMNWTTVCIPRNWGGMGIQELSTQNVALLMRWWWRAYKITNSLLTVVLQRLYLNARHNNGPPFWVKKGSFFWSQLHSIRLLFNFSITYQIQSRRSISFWYDPWCGSPLIPSNGLQPRPPGQRISIRGAASQMQLLLSHLRTQQQEHAAQTLSDQSFTEDPDKLLWRWSKSQMYSANSFYSCFSGAGRTRSATAHLWRTKAPGTVKIFFYLLMNDRLLTFEIIRRRKMLQTQRDCIMCRHCPMESALHCNLVRSSERVQHRDVKARWINHTDDNSRTHVHSNYITIKGRVMENSNVGNVLAYLEGKKCARFWRGCFKFTSCSRDYSAQNKQ
jgi:zinc-binding in reverse transcriptase